MLPRDAKIYISLVIASASAVLLLAVVAWSADNLKQFVIYAGLVAVASTLKIRIPGVELTVSPNFIFLLLAVSACGFSQVVAMSIVGALVQCLWRTTKRPHLVQVVFSTAALILSTSAAYGLVHLVLAGKTWQSSIGTVVLAGGIYFPMNSALITMVIGLASGQSWRRISSPGDPWLFPYFMGGIIFAALISTGYSQSASWKGAVILIPAVALAHLYFLNRSVKLATKPSA